MTSWNELASHCNLSNLLKMTPARKKGIDARENDGMLENIELIFSNIRKSDFLQGKTDRGTWKVYFDWIFCKPNNWAKIAEGNYGNTEEAVSETRCVKCNALWSQGVSNPCAQIVNGEPCGGQFRKVGS